MPIKIVEAGSLDDKQSSKRRPAKWKIKESFLSRKPMNPKDRPKMPGITYPRKPKIITDPEKKKRYQDLLDKSRKMTGSEKRNLIKRRAKRIKEGKEIIRKKHNIGGKRKKVEDRRMPQDIPSTQDSRNEAMKRLKHATGGGADQTSREKLKFHLDKKIGKIRKGIGKKRPTISEYEDLRTRTRKDRKRTKHNIGGRANLLEEMGRLDAEKMNPNRRAEKHRVIGELNKGYKSGGAVLKGKKVGCQIK